MLSAERELMSCLLCAILSEINRPGYMKGLYEAEGSNGKIQIEIGFLSNTSAVWVFCSSPFRAA